MILYFYSGMLNGSKVMYEDLRGVYTAHICRVYIDGLHDVPCRCRIASATGDLGGLMNRDVRSPAVPDVQM